MINKQPQNLVDALEAQNPVLFATYRKTEEVAINHWYPGMSQSNGSVNSYPHVQGIINQLSLVIYHPQCAVTLTDVELYLLLTSILLHDIGKVKLAEDHGKESRNIIRKQWAVLKIENEQMQQIIQNICFLHDRKDGEFKSVSQTLPTDEYIDRYGKVRPRLLGALLYLGDHMDNSYTRTIPEEYTDHFRKNVLGVHFQPEQQMITTVIHPEAFLHKMDGEHKATLYSLAYVQKTMGPLGLYLTQKADETWEREQKDEQEKKTEVQKVGEEGEQKDKPEGKDEPTKQGEASEQKDALPNSPKKSEEDHPNPYLVDLEPLLYLLRDTFVNDACLRNVRNEMYVLGMPIKKWMIECEGQLFLVQKRAQESVVEFLDNDAMTLICSVLEGKSTASQESEDRRLLRQELQSILKDMDLQPDDSGGNLEKVLTAYQNNSGKVQKLKTKQKEAETELQHVKEALAALQIFKICPQHSLNKADDSANGIQLVPCYHAALSVEPLTGYEYCKRVLTAMYDITTTIFAKSFFTYTDICNYMREDLKNTVKVMSAVRRLSYLFQYIEKSKEAKPTPLPKEPDASASAASAIAGEGVRSCDTFCHYQVYYDDCVWNIATFGKGNEDCAALKKTGPQIILGKANHEKLIADWTEEVRIDD